ncbi:MAG: VIT1/CCC1 transporter family protein [Ginsengibacter sp.]
MAQKELHQKNPSLLSYFFNELFINGIDGVVIVFFIATGLMSAGISNKNIIMTGISVVILAALIMGISAYISRKAEKNRFFSLANRDILNAQDLKEKKMLENLDIEKHTQELAQEEIEKDRALWQSLMTILDKDPGVNRYEHAFRSAAITGTAYILGGLIPLIPYLFEIESKTGLRYSSVLSLVTLFILGYFKSVSLKTPLIGGAIASLFKGALAGMGGYFIAKLFVQII